MLALLCCDHREKKPTKVSTKRHMSDESPKYTLCDFRLLLCSSANLGSIPDLCLTSVSLEFCQDSQKEDEEVENRNAAINPSFRFSRLAS